MNSSNYLQDFQPIFSDWHVDRYVYEEALCVLIWFGQN